MSTPGYTASGELCRCPCHVDKWPFKVISPCSCSPQKPSQNNDGPFTRDWMRDMVGPKGDRFCVAYFSDLKIRVIAETVEEVMRTADEVRQPFRRMNVTDWRVEEVEEDMLAKVMDTVRANVKYLNLKADEWLSAEYAKAARSHPEWLRGDSIASGYYPELKSRIIAADVKDMTRTADEIRDELGPRFDPVWQDKRCLEWPEPPVFARDYSQASIDPSVAHPSQMFHFKLDRDRRLVLCDEKGGDLMATVDSDKLAEQLTEQMSQHGQNTAYQQSQLLVMQQQVAALENELSAVKAQMSALQTQQEANHAALLQAVNALTQPATTAPKE